MLADAMNAIVAIATLVFAAILVFFEWHTDEVTVVLAALITSSAILGYLKPAWFVAVGVALGATLSLAHLSTIATGWIPRYEVRPPSLMGALSLAVLIIPAVIGAGAGAGLRRIMRSMAN